MQNVFIRLFILLIYFLIILFSPRRYRRSWGIMRTNGEYTYSYDLTPIVQNFVRHFFSIRKAKKYITKISNCYILENTKVKMLFDTKNYSLKCYSKDNLHRSFKVYAADKKISYTSEMETNENYFNKHFYNICDSFGDNTSYTGIKKYLESNYELSEEKEAVHEVSKVKRKVVAPTVDEIEKIETKEKIDINSAEETDIVALPGINVVLAKKIIKYRNLNNGFKNKEEFYEQMGIKPHFQEQLDQLITIKVVKTAKKSNKNNDDRIIDL